MVVINREAFPIMTIQKLQRMELGSGFASPASTVSVRSLSPVVPIIHSNRSISRYHAELVTALKESKGRMGVRRKRRADNEKYLETLTEEDIEDDNILEQRQTIFATIGTSFMNTALWGYFTYTCEEAQRKHLDDVTTRSFRGGRYQPNYDVEDLSPKQRYLRITQNQRSPLKRNCDPQGFLSDLEEHIISAFSDNPKFVYISEELSSYHRLLLHGLCQYYMLQSVGKEVDGARRVEVWNSRSKFILPKQKLTNYIRDKQCR